MKKIHFIFELALMAMSAIMIILLIIFPNAMVIYFLAWMIILVTLQFIHALVLTYHFKKDLSIWHSLRIYWVLIALSLIGILFRKEPWFSKQVATFIVFVLPWFAAIYLTLITYRFRSQKEVVKNTQE